MPIPAALLRCFIIFFFRMLHFVAVIVLFAIVIVITVVGGLITPARRICLTEEVFQQRYWTAVDCPCRGSYAAVVVVAAAARCCYSYDDPPLSGGAWQQIIHLCLRSL
jgi:hypothetical protein